MTFNTLHFLNSYFHFTISSLEDFIDISQSLNEKHQSTEFWQVSFCRIRMFKPVQSTVVNPSIWVCKSFMTRWRRKIGNWSQEFVVFSLLVVKHLWQKWQMFTFESGTWIHFWFIGTFGLRWKGKASPYWYDDSSLWKHLWGLRRNLNKLCLA